MKTAVCVNSVKYFSILPILTVVKEDAKLWRMQMQAEMEDKMEIGNMQEFRQQQLGKVKKRQEEDKKIKKGIYQMHVMVDNQCMETFEKEQKKAGEKTEGAKPEENGSEGTAKENKKKDLQTEIEKMLAVGRKNVSLNQV